MTQNQFIASVFRIPIKHGTSRTFFPRPLGEGQGEGWFDTGRQHLVPRRASQGRRPLHYVYHTDIFPSPDGRGQGEGEMKNAAIW